MTCNSSRRTPLLAVIWLATVAASATGCTTLKLQNLPFNTPETKYQGVDSGFDMQTSVSEQVYYGVRRAKSENAIVLQVVGDDTPIRVLPLPPDDQSVYVSNLIKETGVQKKLGTIEATLFRNSTASIGGIPMVVKMSRNGTVLPESDYALKAGDRLRINEAPHPALNGMLNAVLGL